MTGSLPMALRLPGCCALLLLAAGPCAAGGGAGAMRPLEACYKHAATRLDVGECLDRRLDEADAAREAVATALQQQVAALDRATASGGVAEAFEESERAFREYLDRHCAWIGAMAAPGSGAGDLVKDCAIRLTELHTLDLRSQLPVPRSAAAAAPPPPGDVIPGGEWRLIAAERDGRPVSLPPDPPVTLAVDPNGMIAGRACVNRYFGKVAPGRDGRLGWSGPIGSTRMSGPPELMDAESAYLKLLGRTNRWRVQGETLTLESDDGKARLRFRR